jgi:Leucine-rich repeat (LRR) protein
LKQLVCNRNHLTALPYLPMFLRELSVDNNDITRLPMLPTLTSLSCCWNPLTFLPSLPHGLESLFCFATSLETMPEFPSTLVYLVCTLPHTKERFARRHLTPKMIHLCNRKNQEWAESVSMDRCMKRCSVFYDDLMHNRWNPDRVFQLRDMGYKLSDI